jgi:hypothetical protein
MLRRLTVSMLQPGGRGGKRDKDHLPHLTRGHMTLARTYVRKDTYILARTKCSTWNTRVEKSTECNGVGASGSGYQYVKLNLSN